MRDDYRVPWVEAWIEHQPDGILHQAPKQGEKQPNRRGNRSEYDQDEIKICLSCPLKECALERNLRCRRLSGELKKRREKRKHDKGD